MCVKQVNTLIFDDFLQLSVVAGVMLMFYIESNDRNFFLFKFFTPAVQLWKITTNESGLKPLLIEKFCQEKHLKFSASYLRCVGIK